MKFLKVILFFLICLVPIVAGAQHSVTISWQQPGQPFGETVKSVNIYKDGAKLTSVPLATLSYVDSTVQAGETHLYGLSNVDTNGLQSPIATISATVPGSVSPPSCNATTATWQNFSFTNQTTAFTVTFDASVNQTASDGVVGFSQAPGTDYTNFAAMIRFNTSNAIDARNGGTYSSVSPFSYAPNTIYHFRVLIDPVAHTYNAFVTAPGGLETQIANAYAFRTESAMTSVFANWGLLSDAGILTVCNLAIVSPPVSVVVAILPTSATIVVNGSQQFTANVPVTWHSSVGSISSIGLYTAPSTAGTATVMATSITDPTKSASAPVTITSVVTAPPSFSCTVKGTTGSTETLTVLIQNFHKGQSISVNCGVITHP